MPLCWGKLSCQGLHPETQALYVDETSVSVSFTHTSPGPHLLPPPLLALLASLSHQHFPLPFSNIPNNRLHHPPTLSHPLPSSPAPQALNLALVSLSLKPLPFSTSLLHPLFPLSLVCLSLPHSLFSSPPPPPPPRPPIISLGSVRCCSADEGEDIAASALIL